MVHAFCGVIVSFIDDDWKLHEYVLNLIALNGDHTGKTVGNLVYKMLKQYKIARKLSMSVCFPVLKDLQPSFQWPVGRTMPPVMVR